MASSGLDLSNLTPDNGAIKSLSQLIFLAAMDPDRLGNLVNFLVRQEHGKKVGFVGEFGLIGKKAQGCDPTYGNDLISTGEKEWDIKEWEVAEQICYKDLESTVAKVALNKGTSIDDVTSTDYMDDIVEPRLNLAITKLIMRLAFFGDKDATTYASSSNESGTIKEGVSADYFNVTDGLWKHIFKGVTEEKITRVEIAANNQTSPALQKQEFKKAGIATGILDSMIESAKMVLRQQVGQTIYMTQLFADALSADIKANNKGSELQWESIFLGITRTTYNGVTIYAVPFWDEIIQSCLKNTTNKDAWDKPYRAIYTVKDNLLVGTESEDELAEVEIFFDQKTRYNHIFAKDTLGTLVAQEDLMVVAF